MPGTIQLGEDKAQARGSELVRLIETDIRDRQSNIKKQEFVRAAYFGELARRRTLRYAGQSNIELRVVTDKIEGSVPKMVNSFWNAEPTVFVQRVGAEFDPDQTDQNQIYLNHLLDTDIPDFYATTEMWFRNTFLDGVSVVKPWFNYETRDTVLVEVQKKYWFAGDTDLVGQPVPQDRLKTPIEIIIEQFGGFAEGTSPKGILDIRPAEGLEFDPAAEVESYEGIVFELDIVENRQVFQGLLVEFHDSRYIDEVELYIHRPIVIKNNVEVDVVEFEDLIVPYRTTNLQSAERVTQQYWLTVPEIAQRIAEGWDISEEDFERIKAEATGERQEEHPENDRLKKQKDSQIGETGRHSMPALSLEPYVDSKVLIFEVYAREDVHGTGSFSEVIYQIPFCLEKVVDAQYLEESFPHGRRPFVDLHYLRISDRYYSISMGELLAPIHVEVNSIINMVNEAQELINNPWFGYVPSALTTDPEILENIEPGQGIPLGDINGLMFPSFPQQPLANLSAVDSMLLFADRLTLSPQSVGSSQARNSPRTARGTLALLSEGNVKTDMVVTGAQKGGWRELVHQVHALESRFGEEEKWFHVVGEAKPRRITQQEMRGRFMYQFSGNSVNTNREVMRTISQIRFNTLAGDPMYMQDLQARQHLIKDFLRHFGEGTNVDVLLPKIPGQTGSRLPVDPKTAIRIIMAGQPIHAIPGEDHAGYVEHISRFGQSKEFDLLPEWQAALISNLLNQHQQLLLQQQQQGGVPDGPGAGNNVPQGGDLGNLEGGVV